jgi:hypothetical protein
VVIIGENPNTTRLEAIDARSFAEFKNDHAALIETLQRSVDQSDYVIGAIRSLGFDVREDTVVEKMSGAEIAAVTSYPDTGVVPAFANTSAAVCISLHAEDRNVRFVAVAGAGWYKVMFANR